MLMEEIRLTSWYGKYPIIYRVLYIPGGCLGFLPSTVLPKKNPLGLFYQIILIQSIRIVSIPFQIPVK